MKKQTQFYSSIGRTAFFGDMCKEHSCGILICKQSAFPLQERLMWRSQKQGGDGGDILAPLPAAAPGLLGTPCSRLGSCSSASLLQRAPRRASLTSLMQAKAREKIPPALLERFSTAVPARLGLSVLTVRSCTFSELFCHMVPTCGEATARCRAVPHFFGFKLTLLIPPATNSKRTYTKKLFRGKDQGYWILMILYFSK